jgi:hypothetical protein|nr:DUF5677 domain-containing protein [Candidatus Acidoferrales bacterium]
MVDGSDPRVRALSVDEYLVKLREQVDALKVWSNTPDIRFSSKTRERVLLYFINRAVQIGEAAFYIPKLRTPLALFARTLCEDLFLLFWASQSEAKALEFEKRATSASLTVLRKNLEQNRARIRHRETGEDVTQQFLPEIKDLISESPQIRTLAFESGLGKVYDILYRFNSLDVHGNTFGLPLDEDKNSIPVIVSAIVAFLRAMLFIVKGEAATAEDILQVLNIRSVEEDQM